MGMNTTKTMWMLLHAYVCLTGLSITVFAGEINVAHESSCSASSTSFLLPCENAIDENTYNVYSGNGEGVGLWFKLILDRTYRVTRLNIWNAYRGRNKDLTLTFSDGSTQEVTLRQNDLSNEFPITPVWTNSLLIQVSSVYYTSITGDTGFLEIQVFADPDDEQDVDECALNTDYCDVNARCVNTPGSYTCTCFSDFNGDGITCTDVDECALKTTNNCDEKAQCVNTPGSYTCTCSPGFTGDGYTCTDVDECVLKTDNCHVNAGCVNNPGSFNCTCFPGFNGDGLSCNDIDECDFKTTNNCDVNAECVNTPGLYNCTCFTGFNGDGLKCIDVDECALISNNCDVNAACVNTPGLYNCTCFTGFNGDGLNCTDVDECDLKKNNNCDVNAECVNTPGLYNCTCFTGFNGDGLKCIDVDECALKKDNCDVNAACLNIPGSYNCTCFPDFNGDGFKCTNVSSTNQTQYCRCPCPKYLTKEESKAFMKEILDSLTINKTKAPAYRRKHISAPDERVSAQSFGYAGTALLVIIFGGIFISDLPRLITDFKQLIHNLCNIGR